MRNSLPPATEGRDFERLPRSLVLTDKQAVCPGDAWERLSAPDRAWLGRLAPGFGTVHNPFIRHIVRHTREFLDNTEDPATGEPYLRPIRVELFGESEAEAVRLRPTCGRLTGWPGSFAGCWPGGCRARVS